jgi:predicted PurR-regulated permease PerM
MPDVSDTPDKESISFTKKVWITIGIIILAVVSLLFLKTVFSVLLLTLAAVLVAIYFYGFAGILERNLHFSPKLSIILSVILNILLLVAFFWFVGSRLQQQLAQLSETLPQTIQDFKGQLQQSTLGNKALTYLRSTGSSEKTTAVAKKFFSSSFGILSDLYIILLLSLFFTASPSSYKKGIVHLLPPKAKKIGADLLDEIALVLKKWLKGMIYGFFFITVLTAIGLLIIGIPLVLSLALIAGLLNFIPNFGPIIALIPAGLLGLMQGTTTAIIVISMYTIIQIIQSAIMQPMIQKKMVNIPPALTVIGQVAFGMLAGFWGVLLAVPLVAILMTTIDKLYVEQQAYQPIPLEEKR